MATNNATQGDDTFTNTAGSDTFNGLQGTDTVLYSGYSYVDGMVTVNDTGNLKTTVDIDGIVDNLKWVEWLQFDNGKYDVANRTFTPNPQVVSVVATGLLLVSLTPSLGVILEPEVEHGTQAVCTGVQA